MSLASGSLIASPTNILTIHDVILDSPVWRANLLHLEDQIEHFEKWIDGFLRALKGYIDVIKKYNTQASTLCKKTFFHDIDDSLIESDIVGNVINKFASTLQSTIAYKMKMASDIEDLLYNPLQKLMRQDIKDYKDCKKQFDKTLDKYETQLYRYNQLSKQREASALREDAFQMYDHRKSYIRSSGEYFMKLISFKSTIENMLIEYFSNALNLHMEELDESTYVYDSVKDKLSGWKQWLLESKDTSAYQLDHIKHIYSQLEDVYIKQMKPPRTLKRYSSNLTDTHESAEEDQNQLKKRRRKSSSLSKNDSLSSMDDTQDNLVLKYDKQGYLNCRILSSKSTRSSWARKWFFLQKGWFGICTVSTVNKEKGCIILSDRVPISECTYKVNNDSDRRYCFEVIHPKCSYYLQSEDETYMQEWLRIIKYNIDNSTYQISATPFPGALLFPLNELNNLSSSITNNDHYQPLIYMSSSLSIHPPDYSPTMLTPTLSTTSFSLTSLMINEDQSIQHTTTTTPTSSNPLPDNLKSPQLTSWTVPWLTSSLTSFSNLDDTAIDNNRQTEIDQLIVWPTKIEMNVPRPDLSHYSSQLEMRNKELRRVFSNVPQSEVVIDSFFASLSYKDTANDLSTTDGTLKLGYSGIVYITQNYLWFYSCKFMTCVNIIVLPLRCINTVQLQDAKLSKSELLLDTVFESCRPITFGIWLETPEIIYERLKVIIQNTKSESPVDIQRLYDSVRMITPTKLNKKKIPTNHVTTSSALYASVTPLTVQGQQQIYTPVMKQDISSSTANTVEENGSVGNPVHSDYPEESISSSPAQGALKAAYRKSLPANVNNQKVENKQETAIKAAESDWPKSEPASTEPANCVCDGHSDKQFNFTFDMEAKRLFDMLFGDEGRIWIEFNQLKGYGQPMISQWQTMGGGVRERTVKYIMPVSNPMVKAKETDVTDVQEILSEKEGVAYTVKVTTKTPNLPYGDAFTPYIKYCITYLTPNSCRLLCTIDVKWLRSILVKGIINRAAMKGMEETVSAIVSCVQKNLTADHRSAEMIREQNKEKPALPESMESSIQLGVNKKMAKSQQSLLYMISVGCILFMLYQLHILGQYKSRMNYYLNGGQNNTMILWRGVYLRDIEKEITENHVVLGNVNQRIYKQFQDSRVNEASWEYDWANRDYRYMASELGFIRERLGALRYELLSAFRILNRVEYELLESQYWNWVSDKRLKCKEDNSSYVCEEILKEQS